MIVFCGSCKEVLETNTTTEILTYDEEGKAHNLIGDKIDPKIHKFLKSRALSGYDFDATMVRLGAMNLMLHGVDNPNFQYADSLSKQFNEKTKLYEKDTPIPVDLSAFSNRSFTFKVKSPPTSWFLKKCAGVELGSARFVVGH